MSLVAPFVTELGEIQSGVRVPGIDAIVIAFITPHDFLFGVGEREIDGSDLELVDHCLSFVL